MKLLNGSAFRLAAGRQASRLRCDPHSSEPFRRENARWSAWLFAGGPGLLLHERNLPFNQFRVGPGGNISKAVAQMVQSS
jgi:hypothetical protein